MNTFTKVMKCLFLGLHVLMGAICLPFVSGIFLTGMLASTYVIIGSFAYIALIYTIEN